MTFNIYAWHKCCLDSIFLLFTTSSSTLLAQTVVVLADTPYSDKEKEILQGPNGTIYDLINNLKPSIVMHLGNLKSGGKSCIDDLLRKHKVLLAQIYPGKLIYTLGDNDWTDCDRISLPYSFDELERLDFLMTLMFETPSLFTKNLPLIINQETQIENKLWINDRLAISTLHIIGASNGRVNIGKSNQNDAIKAVNKRDEKNLSWLKSIEDNSKEFDTLIIGFQADIYQQSVVYAGTCDDTLVKACDAFTNVSSSLQRFGQTN